MLKIFLFTFLICNLLFAKNDLEKVSLQLHWKYQFEFAGFIAAKEKGFYKDVGLEVELKEYTFGENIIKDVSNQKSNYGIYNSNILLEYLKNEPLQLLSSYFKKSALVLITKPNIKKPKDLIGKKIMAAGRDDFNLNFNFLFSMQNIDTNDLILTQHTFSIDEFATGKVDAMTAFISDQPFKLDTLDIPYNIIDPSDYGLFNLQLELFTSVNEATKYRDRTENFKKASLKGWEYALNNPSEIIEIILQKYNTQNLSRDFLINEAIITKRLILPKMYEIGSIDEMFLFRQIDNISYKHSKYSHENKMNLIENFIFYTNEELEKKKIESNYKILKNSIPFLIIILILIVGIVIYRQILLNKYNKKLKEEVKEKTEKYKIKNNQLKTSNKNFSKLLDSAIEAIAIFDENDKLIKLNYSGIQMFGYEVDEKNSQIKLNDFIPENLISDIKNKIENNIHEPIEIDLYKKDKLLFPTLISGRKIKQSENYHLILTIVDLTQIKVRDEFIQQQAKLAQMGELLSMIAHQWRQPLTAISAASETLRIKSILNDLNSQDVQSTADDISKYTTHLSNTINDFRNFYKIDKSIEQININKLVEKSLNILQSSIIFNEIELIKDYKSEYGVNTFISEVTQVILTLLQNAEDILVEKKIKKAYIKVSTYEADDSVIISVCDNGGGIPKDIFEKIFDPYFSTKLEKNGTGLGLYFSKRIIEKNCNAILTAENTEDGACFKIIFNKN